jgi:para-aminobenzoate synthetase
VALGEDVSFWSLMERAQLALREHTATGLSSPSSSSALVGFFGYFGYEMKHEVLSDCRTDFSSSRSSEPRPDAQFAFANGVLAFEHATGSWFAYALIRDSGQDDDDDDENQVEKLVGCRFGFDEEQCRRWFDSVDECFRDTTLSSKRDEEEKPPTKTSIPFVCDTSAEKYKQLIDEARRFIADGESYELCLTTQFRHLLNENDVSDYFPLYVSLRARNPAPYSAYLRFAPFDVSVLSTSPERFMRIEADGQVEMKPIKGTVKRDRTCESLDAALRDGLASSAKERAESLMIVDLIRNELASFCEPSSVVVEKLAQIETYETVHQLVSSIKGSLSRGVSPVEALRRCFPPGEFVRQLVTLSLFPLTCLTSNSGSMTGAPKHRSVHILEELEGYRPRGVYSGWLFFSVRGNEKRLNWRRLAGVLGYISIDGRMDFNVVIRTIIAHGRGRLFFF